MKYLFIVDYEDDAERKRIDYLLEKWREHARISKPKGLTFIVEIEEIDKFAEELFSKLNPESSMKVKAFTMHEKDLQSKIRPNKLGLEYQSEESPETVKKFLEYIFSKNNIHYYSSDIKSSKYFTLTRKGRVDIEVVIEPKKNKTQVKLLFSGYGEALEYVVEKLKEELEPLLGV